METFSALLALCVGNSPVTGEYPAQRPVTRSFDVFYDLHLNKRLSKQSWGWWFETPLRPLWRHCNVLPGDFGGARQQLQSGEAIVAIVIGLLVLLGLVGNIVSFLTFGKMPKNATTFLLCSLAVIDSSFLLLTAIPLAMKLYAVQWVGCCDLSFRFITNFFTASSRIACMAVVWTSVITGMNCYIVVCPPHQAARLCTTSRARKQLLWTVLFSIVYALPRVFRYKSTKMSKAWQKYFYVIGCKMAFRLAIPFAMLLFFLRVNHCYTDSGQTQPLGLHGGRHVDSRVTLNTGHDYSCIPYL